MTWVIAVGCRENGRGPYRGDCHGLVPWASKVFCYLPRHSVKPKGMSVEAPGVSAVARGVSAAVHGIRGNSRGMQWRLMCTAAMLRQKDKRTGVCPGAGATTSGTPGRGAAFSLEKGSPAGRWFSARSITATRGTTAAANTISKDELPSRAILTALTVVVARHLRASQEKSLD